MTQPDSDEKTEAGKEDIDVMSFEKALEELERIVEQLERGNESLADGVALYERGVALKTRCEALLKDAQMKVEKIEMRASGDAVAVPMEAAKETSGDGDKSY